MKFFGGLMLVFFVLTGKQSACQQPGIPDTASSRTISQTIRSKQKLHAAEDSLVILRAICKGYYLMVFEGYESGSSLIRSFTPPEKTTTTPFISVHGNVQYEYFYRSFMDTPFMQKDISQHFVQTNLYLTIKDHYPVKLSFQTRQSNSPFFQNSFDANLQFNRQLA